MRPTIYGRPVSLLRSEFRQSNPVAQSGNLIDVTPVHNESDFLDEELAQLDFRARNGPEPVRFDNTRARLMKQVASRWVLPSDWNDSFLFHCSSFFLFFFARHSLPFDGCVALSARFLSRFFVVVFFSVWISAGVSMLEIINYLAKIARFLDPTPRWRRWSTIDRFLSIDYETIPYQ